MVGKGMVGKGMVERISGRQGLRRANCAGNSAKPRRSAEAPRNRGALLPGSRLRGSEGPAEPLSAGYSGGMAALAHKLLLLRGEGKKT